MDEDFIDKIVEPYLDLKFKNAVEMISHHKEDNQDWFGYWIDDDNLIVGKPVKSQDIDRAKNFDNYPWFTNGRILNGWGLFGLEPSEFNQAVGRYIQKKFGVKVSDIM